MARFYFHLAILHEGHCWLQGHQLRNSYPDVYRSLVGHLASPLHTSWLKSGVIIHSGVLESGASEIWRGASISGSKHSWRPPARMVTSATETWLLIASLLASVVAVDSFLGSISCYEVFTSPQCLYRWSPVYLDCAKWQSTPVWSFIKPLKVS